MNLCKQKCHKTCDTYLAGLWLSSSLKTYIYNIKKICLKCSICVRLMWEGKKESKHKEYRLNWRILIEKPERRSKHVLKANVASTVTLMSIIDIPQYSEFYVLLVKLAMLYNKRSWHFQFPFFFSFYSRGGGGDVEGSNWSAHKYLQSNCVLCVWNIASSFLITNDWS